MIWFTILALASIALADYSQPSSDNSYGVAQQPSVQVQTYPIYGKPTYNKVLNANVKKGRFHGAFDDAFIDNYSKSDSRSDSDESYERHPKRRNHHSNRNYGSYYSAPAYWPYYGQQYEQPLSNPFFVPSRRYRSRSNHGRRHHKSNSVSDSNSWEDRSY